MTTLTIDEFKELIRECMYIPSQPVQLTTTKEILNIDEACAFVGISKGSMYKHTMNREIPHCKTGKKLIFNRNELIEWVGNHRVKTKKEIEDEATNYLINRRGKYGKIK